MVQPEPRPGRNGRSPATDNRRYAIWREDDVAGPAERRRRGFGLEAWAIAIILVAAWVNAAIVVARLLD